MEFNKIILSLSTSFLLVFTACSDNNYGRTHKDLDENMLDLKVYQENLGDHIKKGELKDAEWLFEGMDSVLKVVSVTFPEHRKLEKPFAEYYDIKMKKPVDDIRAAIKKNDQPAALEGYKVLVRRCNSCHKDLDIDKEVKF